mmetsp:Transcript_16362/g.35357  ORF Transcript_16362/g.35357 Transcript_16362/m.35357 type:complete len:200 (-) Transcript_16362:99-698(-)
MLTRRNVMLYKATNGAVDIFNALRSKGRQLGPLAAWKMLAAGALEEDLAGYVTAHFENIAANYDVSGIDPADITLGVELHAEGLVDRIVRRGQRGRGTSLAGGTTSIAGFLCGPLGLGCKWRCHHSKVLEGRVDNIGSLLGNEGSLVGHHAGIGCVHERTVVRKLDRADIHQAILREDAVEERRGELVREDQGDVCFKT